MTAEVPRLLLVLDDQSVADSLRAEMARSPFAADLRFAASAPEAIGALGDQPADYVFADIHLPGSDGVALLRSVEASHPATVRVIVADPRELGSLQSSDVAHRYLGRPWDIAAVTGVLRRRYELEAWLDNPGLQQALQRTDRLPAAPSAYTRIAAEMRSPDPSLDRVAAIVGQDPALTAKVLQHVNSAYFALRHEIKTIERAVAMIGTNALMAIVMAIGLYGGPGAAPAFVIEVIRSQAQTVAGLTRAIARIEGLSPAERDTAFLAGMLHDCGRLVMANSWPETYAEMAADQDLELESRMFGADHALMGAYVLSTWNLADSVVEAVAHHHRPSAGNFEDFGAVGLVHVAHAVAHRPGNGTLPLVDLDFMGRFELWDHAAAWIAAADEMEYEVSSR